MNSDYRYNRDQISKILKRAAELERRHDINDDGEGLTAEELEKISKDVGLHPHYIRQAIREMDEMNPPGISRLFGGPFTYFHKETIRGTLSEEELEEFISEIRQIQGNPGKINKLGRTFEWEQREQDIGYAQINLSPKKEHTNITINANYKDNAALLYGTIGMLGTACCAILIAILYKKAGLPLFPLLVGGALFLGGLFTGIRSYLKYFMKKKDQAHRRIFKRFRELFTLGSDSEKEKNAGSSVIEFSPKVKDEQEPGLSSGQQRQNLRS